MLDHDLHASQMDRFFNFPQGQVGTSSDAALITSILDDLGDIRSSTSSGTEQRKEAYPAQAVQQLPDLPSVFPTGEVIGDSSLGLSLVPLPHVQVMLASA